MSTDSNQPEPEAPPQAPSLDDELTFDPIFFGRLRLFQPKTGYRFSIDPLLLCDFVLSRFDEAPRRVLDLGCGAGIIALGLQSRRTAWEVEALEIQPRLAAIARRNVAENQLPIVVHEADMRQKTLPGARFDLVVSNPPYYRTADGPPSAERELAIARHETEIDLPGWLNEARRLLRPAAFLCCIFPVVRLEDLIVQLGQAGLALSALRFVHSLADRPAELVLIAAKKRDGRGSPPLEVVPPLVIYDKPGTYAAEAQKIFW